MSLIKIDPTKIVKNLKPLSAWQVRKVLNQYGIRETVESAILTADKTTQDAWQYATEFKRDDAVLLAMAQMLNLTDAQLDQMFELGIAL